MIFPILALKSFFVEFYQSWGDFSGTARVGLFRAGDSAELAGNALRSLEHRWVVKCLAYLRTTARAMAGPWIWRISPRGSGFNRLGAFAVDRMDRQVFQRHSQPDAQRDWFCCSSGGGTVGGSTADCTPTYEFLLMRLVYQSVKMRVGSK